MKRKIMQIQRNYLSFSILSLKLSSVVFLDAKPFLRMDQIQRLPFEVDVLANFFMAEK